MVKDYVVALVSVEGTLDCLEKKTADTEVGLVVNCMGYVDP